MAVRATKTELRCKLCASAKREEIDALLERRSKREQGVNLEFVLAQLGEWGIPNPTEENVKNHWRKHCEVISEKAAEATRQVRERLANELPADATVDDRIDWLLSLKENEMAELVAMGETLGITHDHYIKLLELKTRRRQSEEESKLFRSIGAGLAGALAEGLKPKQLPAPAHPDIVLVEVVEEAEVE